MQPSFTRLSIVTIAIAGAAAFMLGAGLQEGQPAQQEQAQQEQPEQAQAEPQAKQSTLVAIFDPQAVFMQSERATRLNEALAEIQAQMQAAQQGGDMQTAMQLQQQAQQMQSTEVQAFLADVDAVLPEIAKEAGVKIIAVEFEYVDESLGTPQDVTEALSAVID